MSSSSPSSPRARAPGYAPPRPARAGSAMGAMIGYAIGAGFMATLGQGIVDFYGAQAHWDRVVALYNGEWGHLVLGGRSLHAHSVQGGDDCRRRDPDGVRTLCAGEPHRARRPVSAPSRPSFVSSEQKSAGASNNISTRPRCCSSPSCSADFLSSACSRDPNSLWALGFGLWALDFGETVDPGTTDYRRETSTHAGATLSRTQRR